MQSLLFLIMCYIFIILTPVVFNNKLFDLIENLSYIILIVDRKIVIFIHLFFPDNIFNNIINIYFGCTAMIIIYN